MWQWPGSKSSVVFDEDREMVFADAVFDRHPPLTNIEVVSSRTGAQIDALEALLKTDLRRVRNQRPTHSVVAVLRFNPDRGDPRSILWSTVQIGCDPQT